MIYPSPDKLDRACSKYALVIVAAKRARQIKDGARRLVPSTSSNPLTVALEELSEGALIPLHVGGPERLPDMVAQGPVLQGLVASSDADDLDDLPISGASGAARLALADSELDPHALLRDDHEEDDLLEGEPLEEDHMLVAEGVELVGLADDDPVTESDDMEDDEDAAIEEADLAEDDEPGADDEPFADDGDDMPAAGEAGSGESGA
jgi:DNA-directed RNA polymerase subunit omega